MGGDFWWHIFGFLMLALGAWGFIYPHKMFACLIIAASVGAILAAVKWGWLYALFVFCGFLTIPFIANLMVYFIAQLLWKRMARKVARATGDDIGPCPVKWNWRDCLP